MPVDILLGEDDAAAAGAAAARFFVLDRFLDILVLSQIPEIG